MTDAANKTDYSAIGESVAKFIAHVSKPLTEEQKIGLTATLAVWLSSAESAGYAAGRAAAERDSKHAQRWRELCEAVKRALSGETGYVSLWGEDERLSAGVRWQHRGGSQIMVGFYYDAPNEIREDLDAALDKIGDQG